MVMEPATVIGGQQRMMNQTAHDNDEEELEYDDEEELEQDDDDSDTI
ncbi:hypothetical protein A2U01_0010014 [Trifolium medium]|uniref:Uncharacterized protein n=1 Tax=Trifolium medium TaxID=97028 RepID=A0A392MP32_9FABA|nr:hypothetical protein [Trifolium medium]